MGLVKRIEQISTDFKGFPSIPERRRRAICATYGICIGLNKLNDNIQRERYMLSTTDEILDEIQASLHHKTQHQDFGRFRYVRTAAC